MARRNKIEKQIFLEDLPKKGNNIDWVKSIGFKVKFIYENIKGYVEIIDYIKKSHPKIKIKYNNKEMEILIQNFKKCKLGNIFEKQIEFKIDIGTIFKDDKRDITIVDRKIKKVKYDNGYSYNKKRYKYHCNKCGYDKGWIEESHLLKGQGCSCCNNRTVVQGINDIPTTAPWMIKYFQGGYDEAKLYSKNSGKKIYPICPDCGRIKEIKMAVRDIYRNKSIACKKCGDKISYPNKFAFNLLEQLNVEFETEYSPKWISPKRYDFYFKLNDKEYILEMDGELGHDNKMHALNKKTIEESKEIDNYKDRLASEHGVEVIRIDCYYYGIQNRFKFIKNNIFNNNKLNELFDLSNVDWLKCNEYGCTNLIKQACELKKNDPNLTTSQISKIIGSSIGTIEKWLALGNDFSWCHYDANEEKIKNCSFNGISLVCVTTNKAYKSISECSRKDFKDFGVRLSFYGLRKALKNNTTYKGYEFRHISKEEFNKISNQM